MLFFVASIFFKGWLTPVYVEKNCFCNIYFLKNAGFVGFCNTLPAADLSHLFKMLLMLAAKEIRTESILTTGFIFNSTNNSGKQTTMSKTFLFLSSCKPNLQSGNLKAISSPFSAIQTKLSGLTRILISFRWHLVGKNLTKSFD